MIETARLRLRPLQGSDLHALHGIYANDEAMRFWDRPAHGDLDDTRALLSSLMRDAPEAHLEYAVDHDGALIGRVGMWRPYEIGYIFHPDAWGRGFATEALGAFLPALFARYPETRAITAEIDPRNAASDRVLRRLGFTRTGYAEKNFLYGGTDWIDSAYYRLDRPGVRRAPLSPATKS